MKNFNLLAVVVLLFVSCQKDDETFVPRYDASLNFSEPTLTDTSVLLEWDDTQAASYRIEYGVSGFLFGQGEVVTTTIPSVTLTDLVSDTSYDYIIEAIYSINDRSVIRSIHSFTTLTAPVRPIFFPKLSQLRIFKGSLRNLAISPYAFEYDLNSRLYTNYAEKQRVIALPPGSSMSSNGSGLPSFPDKTVIAKTFYYNVDDRDLSLGKQIIETRVMIKINGTWEFGDYIWDANQKDAVLDNSGSTIQVDWIDIEGMTRNSEYKIPSGEDCRTCHQSYAINTLIGPKLRSMNFDINGSNQLQNFINSGRLTNLTDISTIGQLPNWKDTSLTDEVRVRAYFDMNCAHCHSAGGYHTENYFDALNVAYETRFNDSHIFTARNSIMARMQTSIEGYSMPFLGVSTPHTEALDLIIPYLQSLE